MPGLHSRQVETQLGVFVLQEWLLVYGSGKQKQIPIRILDDEIPGAPRLLFQSLVKGNTSGLKLKKQQLDLVRRSDGHRYGQQFLPLADRRLDYWSLDGPWLDTP